MRSPITLIVSSVVIIGLLFGAAYYFSMQARQQAPIVEDPSDDGNVGDSDSAYSITAQHQFIDGVHTIAGEIALPTPCYQLTEEVIVRESFPEQVAIAFTATSAGAELCAQVVTPQPFKVSFEASTTALITATYNGEPVVLNLIKVEPGESLEMIDTMIRG